MPGETYSYFCQRCEKKLEVEKELENNVRRLNCDQRYGYGCAAASKVELKEMMVDKEYVCEKCLGNERADIFG